MCVKFVGDFVWMRAPEGYGNRIQAKSPQSGAQIAGMIFQTRSRTCRLWECFFKYSTKEGRVCNMTRSRGELRILCVNYSYDDDYECYTL